MKNILSIASLLTVTAAFAFGCSSSDNNTNPADDTGTPVDSSGDTIKPPTDTGAEAKAETVAETPTDTPTTPPPPTLGTQIDRMGRPAINTALNHSFDTTKTTKDAAKDAYNQDKDPTNWVKPTVYVPEFMANLGVLDALDAKCGNQLSYKGTTPAADSYSPLAGLLADDRLWLKTDATTCSLTTSPTLIDSTPGGYLAVEGASSVPNNDCGGRTLSYDVMNISYSLLAAGAGGLAPPTNQLDGVMAVPDRSKGSTFPYLAVPH